MDSTFTPTAHTFHCQECERQRVASVEAIQYVRDMNPDETRDMTDAQVATDLVFCIECIDGTVFPAETPAEA